MSVRRVVAVAGAVAALCVSLAACSSGSGAAGGAAAADARGSWGSTEQGEPNLTLSDGAKLSGSDGCNRLIGSWKAEGSTVTFSEVASTRMACEGVDTWLSSLSTATLDGDSLVVKDESGATIGTLSRRSE